MAARIPVDDRLPDARADLQAYYIVHYSNVRTVSQKGGNTNGTTLS